MLFKNITNVSLQTKITGLLLAVIVGLILLLSGFFAYSKIEQIISNKYNLSMQTARTVSLLPSVTEGLTETQSRQSLQFLTDQFSMENDADFIIVQDKDGRILTHPKDEYLGRIQQFKSGYRARVFGGYYNMETEEFIGPSIVGIAPIMSSTGSVQGVVTVGYLKANLWSLIYDRVEIILYVSIAVIVIGILLGYLLARHIRKEIFGYEPREIAELYRNRDTLLSSLNEGVVATSRDSMVTLINESAKKLLDVGHSYVNKPISSLLPNLDYQNVYETKKGKLNQELFINNKTLIVNLLPILTNDKVTGLVATFRDKTEVTEMLNMLSEVKQYSDDLRAQTHEYSNQMHLLHGMLQLGKYDEVLEMVGQEINHHDKINRHIFDQIEDTNVQAILIGKFGKASEKKVDFNIDENSYLSPLPSHIEASDLMIIIGNLIDNAVDEVSSDPNPGVSFSTIDLGNDIIFEVTDNGRGIEKEVLEQIFQPGYSMKKEGLEGKKGFGLANVKSTVDKLNGVIEVAATPDGTIVTVYIPKTDEEVAE
ncbi:ATP-binding protein [Lentibacillus amyloliquefaciens]|uniref:ATP-binding protein n=1 Tax=Lentibacillus amyloliquefaciens TaxID=1472767 RepID=UPI0009E85C70|nr:sensor histidine kinase [Lentibacillus amyloliquefaciens]